MTSRTLSISAGLSSPALQDVKDGKDAPQNSFTKSGRGKGQALLARDIPLVNVDAGLLAGEGGEAAAETTDGSQSEGDLGDNEVEERAAGR